MPASSSAESLETSQSTQRSRSQILPQHSYVRRQRAFRLLNSGDESQQRHVVVRWESDLKDVPVWLRPALLGCGGAMSPKLMSCGVRVVGIDCMDAISSRQFRI